MTRYNDHVASDVLNDAQSGARPAREGTYAFRSEDAQAYSDSWMGPGYIFSSGYTPAAPDPSNPIVSVQFYVAPAGTSHRTPGDLAGWTNVTTASDLANTTGNDAYILQLIERDLLGKSLATMVGGSIPTTFGVDKIGLRFARLPIPLQLAEAVQHLATELCRIVANDPLALTSIEWRDLERLVASALRDIGFMVVLTNPSKDGGKDIVARCQLVGVAHTFYIEVKHWTKKRVGKKEVERFVQVNVADGTQGGLFLSTAGYCGAVYEHRAEITRDVVRLGDHRTVVALARHAIRARDGLWIGSSLPDMLFQHSI